VHAAQGSRPPLPKVTPKTQMGADDADGDGEGVMLAEGVTEGEADGVAEGLGDKDDVVVREGESEGEEV
jgi:hypothetical protein